MSDYVQKFSDGKGNVDWSQAPADATHYTPETDEYFEGWLKVDRGAVYFQNSYTIAADMGWRFDVANGEQVTVESLDSAPYIKR